MRIFWLRTEPFAIVYYLLLNNFCTNFSLTVLSSSTHFDLTHIRRRLWSFGFNTLVEDTSVKILNYNSSIFLCD